MLAEGTKMVMAALQTSYNQVCTRVQDPTVEGWGPQLRVLRSLPSASPGSLPLVLHSVQLVQSCLAASASHQCLHPGTAQDWACHSRQCVAHDPASPVPSHARLHAVHAVLCDGM